MPKRLDILRTGKTRPCTAVIAAAGASVRMGRDKLFLELAGKAVLERSISAFEHCALIDEIIVVTSRLNLGSAAQLCADAGFKKVKKVIIGGETRTESVFRGVMEADRRARLICIHDGARPLVSDEVIRAAVSAASRCGAAAPAVRLHDTLKETDGEYVRATPDRERLRAVQTPQVFDADLIKAALTAALKSGKTYSDDCACAEAIGARVLLCEGSEANIKITTPLDLILAEAILREGE